MLTRPEEEEAVRVLLLDHVADIHAEEDVLARVQAGAQRRQTARRTARRTAFALSAVTVAGCAAAFVPMGLPGSSASAHPAATGASVTVLSAQDACVARPEGYVDPVAKPVGSVPGFTHTMVPGKPVAAVSCPFYGDARTATFLSTAQLADAVSVLNAAVQQRGTFNMGCESPLPKNGGLYLVFEYADGARLSVTATGSRPCGDTAAVVTATEVTWSVSNTADYGHTTTAAQAETLDALAALQ